MEVSKGQPVEEGREEKDKERKKDRNEGTHQ